MFNDPEVSATKAIEFMEEHDFVEPTPAGVARLFREKAGTARKGGLDRREIGEYLAKLKPYNNEVRQAYVETLCGARPAPKSLARELTPTLLPPAQRLHGQDVRGGAARVPQLVPAARKIDADRAPVLRLGRALLPQQPR